MREGRYQELLKKRAWAQKKLSRAKKALGAGSWHEDSNYELADSDWRVWSEYLEGIEDELSKIRKELKGR